ncbi:hypothetical protein L323_13110 [Ruminiclostridium papyrosolvens C7]|uniref:Transposase DDE domain-containing protein n=1 Tax=Ruminiclostridium papyrosolvens C7 TaxID=1330534 RepID=U4QZW3_9FIRM|nr:hypothetical protein L323_13110 [Ruminiclostridium papyrosolvens C7]
MCKPNQDTIIGLYYHEHREFTEYFKGLKMLIKRLRQLGIANKHIMCRIYFICIKLSRSIALVLMGIYSLLKPFVSVPKRSLVFLRNLVIHKILSKRNCKNRLENLKIDCLADLVKKLKPCIKKSWM